MRIPIVKVEVYKKRVVGSTNVYDTVPTEVHQFRDLNITKGIDLTKDTIRFNLKNFRILQDGEYKYSSLEQVNIEQKDFIKVYSYLYPMTGVLNDHLVFSAYVKSLNYDVAASNAMFKLVCYSRSEIMLNSFMISPFNTATRVCDMLAQTSFRINGLNPNDVTYGFKDYTGTTTPGSRGAYRDSVDYSSSMDGRLGYIRAYKNAAYLNDGSGLLKPEYTSSVPSSLIFPEKSYVETYKPFGEIIRQLSVDEYTGDVGIGQYIFYLDQDNNIVWRGRTLATSTDLEITEQEVTSLKLAEDLNDIANAAIINAGTDPNGNGVTAVSYNASSIGRNGAKWKYLGFQNIAEEIKRKEIESGDRYVDGNLISGNDNIGKSIGKDGYPDDYTGGWIIQTTSSSADGGWSYTAGSSTVTSDIEYKNYFRRVAQRQGKVAGDNYVNLYGDGRNTATITLYTPTLAYEPNTVLNIIAESYNFEERMRITSVTHTFKNNWITTLKCKEDEKELTE